MALTRDANLDTQSSNISAEEIRESGRSFQSLIFYGKKLLLYASLLAAKVHVSEKPKSVDFYGSMTFRLKPFRLKAILSKGHFV